MAQSRCADRRTVRGQTTWDLWDVYGQITRGVGRMRGHHQDRRRRAVPNGKYKFQAALLAQSFGSNDFERQYAAAA